MQCLHREPIRTSIYWSLSPLDCGNAWLMDSHHRCNCRRTTLSSCSSLFPMFPIDPAVADDWSQLRMVRSARKCAKSSMYGMILCNKLNAKHRMLSIFCKIHFNWRKNQIFMRIQCEMSVCMTMTPNHNPVIFSPSTHILDYVGINMSSSVLDPRFLLGFPTRHFPNQSCWKSSREIGCR